jgi:hypothetical protein
MNKLLQKMDKTLLRKGFAKASMVKEKRRAMSSTCKTTHIKRTSKTDAAC